MSRLLLLLFSRRNLKKQAQYLHFGFPEPCGESRKHYGIHDRIVVDGSIGQIFEEKIRLLR